MSLAFNYINYFFLAFICVFAYKYFAIYKGIVAIPNERSSHTNIVPVGAGIVFACLWAVLLIFKYFTSHSTTLLLLIKLLPGAILVSVLGFLDDCKHVLSILRLLFQIIAIGITYLILGAPELSLHLGDFYLHFWCFSPIIFTLTMLWSINLFNFMDGIDGLAAMEAIFMLITGGMLFWFAGAHNIAIALWSLACMVLGFGVFNFFRASVFMGDAGSYFLGFIIAGLAWVGEINFQVSAVWWVILYGLFWYDATITLLRRMINKERWFEAHKKHAFQRLQLLSWSHQKIWFSAFCINLILGGLVYWSFQNQYKAILAFFITLLLLSVIYLKIETMVPMKKP